jgi:hypothetical protein
MCNIITFYMHLATFAFSRVSDVYSYMAAICCPATGIHHFDSVVAFGLERGAGAISREYLKTQCTGRSPYASPG